MDKRVNFSTEVKEKMGFFGKFWECLGGDRCNISDVDAFDGINPHIAKPLACQYGVNEMKGRRPFSSTLSQSLPLRQKLYPSVTA